MKYTLGALLLKLEQIKLSFGTNLILRDINFEVKDIKREDAIAGQIITLLGRSGVGKTQLMKIIAGLQVPTFGSVRIGENQEIVQPGRVGMVLQNYPQFVHRTVMGNMLLVCKDKSKIEHLLEEFSIIEQKDKYPVQLSGGQRQRAAIVQQLLCSDDFILLDEPFSGLDPVATEKLCQNIAKAANLNENNTVVISSHILEPALAISDTAIMLGYEKIEDVKVPGATILHKFDLAQEGLAWQPDIRRNPKFVELCEDIRNIFQTL